MRWVFQVLVVLGASLICRQSLLAQPGTPVQNVVVVEGQPSVPPNSPGRPAGAPPNAVKKVEPGKPADGKAPAVDGEVKTGGGGAEPVKRPAAPPEPPNKKELDVKPDETGRVQFQFRHQAWPDVLRWLAEVSSMSLDWQELPGDYLNLATQRPYSIDETRDLINRHLLARGYTMLELDGVLVVCKTEGINTALVPKVTVDALKSLPPNRYVRTSFSLESLIAEDVIDEFKLLISANGKLVPLAATNRLEAMDAAGNLQELAKILTEEQSDQARDELAKEFVLQFVRASEVKSQLELFLGLQKSSSPGSSDPNSSRQQMQVMQEMMQQQQQMMQQRGADGKTLKPDMSKKRSEVYLVANQRQNSIIVHAAPDKMAIVESFVRRMDVPNEKAANLQAIQARTRVFRLASINPKQLVASLLAMDALEPTTQLEVDETNNSIIAHASLADQFTIQQVIERLDGSARNFQTFELRRLKADEVAGTIKFLMGAEKETKEDTSSRRYSYYDPFGSRSDDKKKTEDKFRVGANVADNQLLLWCNETEHKEVLNLLVKLGEIPPAGSRPSPFRTIDATRSRETLEYLKNLQEKWKSISPNPLKLPTEEQIPKAEDSQETQPVEPTKAPTAHQPQSVVEFEKLIAVTLGNQDSASTGNDNASQEPSNAIPGRDKMPMPPAIEIRFDPDGNLILSSSDTEALDQLESLMLRDAPPQRPYDVFQVKNTRATWIALNLEDYFKEDEKQRNESRNTYYFFDGGPTDTKKEDPQLGVRRKLRFISDIDTNTIVVIGASDSQRQTIKELIELWDTPDPKKAEDARYQRLIQIRYSRAEAIEQAIKDVYRDFLSANDKTFDRKPEEGNRGGEEKRDRSSATRKFSLGVDKVTNILIVSAEGEDFLNVICELVKQLDEAAKPSGTLQVVPFDVGGNGAKSMEKAFKAMVEAAKQPPPQNGKRPNPNGQPNEGGQQSFNGEQ